MAITYDKIATTTLGSASATITFSSIAASWTDIRVIFVGTSSAGSNINIRFNNDSTTTYSATRLYGDGATASSNRSTSATNINPLANLFASTQPQLLTIDLFSYTGSTNKTCLITFNSDLNGSGNVASSVGLWRDTTAVNRIDILNAGGATFNIGTTATLYGILKA